MILFYLLFSLYEELSSHSILNLPWYLPTARDVSETSQEIFTLNLHNSLSRERKSRHKHSCSENEELQDFTTCLRDTHHSLMNTKCQKTSHPTWLQSHDDSSRLKVCQILCAILQRLCTKHTENLEWGHNVILRVNSSEKLLVRLLPEAATHRMTMAMPEESQTWFSWWFLRPESKALSHHYLHHQNRSQQNQ